MSRTTSWDDPESTDDEQVKQPVGRTFVTLEIEGRAALDDLAVLLGDAEDHVVEVRYRKDADIW